MAMFDFLYRQNKDRGGNRGNNACRSNNNIVENPDKPSPKAVIYKSELDYISRCILDYPNIETGGQLFGYWTSLGTPVVLYAIGPGPRSQHNKTSFVQDPHYLQSIGNKLYDRYRLQHIGEWHSHHQLALAHPSGGDVNTMRYGVGKPGFPRLLLCIGNCTSKQSTLNAFNFHENTGDDYVQAMWDIVKGESPFRRVVDMEFNSLLNHPMTRVASHGRLYTTSDYIPEDSQAVSHWIMESADNVATMKQFVSMVKSISGGLDVRTEMLDSGEPQIAIKGSDVNILFPHDFPEIGPVLKNNDNQEYQISKKVKWEIGEENLTMTFGRWIAETLPTLIMPSKEDNIENASSQHRNEEMNTADALLMERLSTENQILSTYFSKTDYRWKKSINNYVLYIALYPFDSNPSGVVRLTVPADYPNSAPMAEYGFFSTMSFQDRLPENLQMVEFKPISTLFKGAGYLYRELLHWDEMGTLLRSYLVADIIINNTIQCSATGRDPMVSLYPLQDNKDILTDKIRSISEKLTELKK